MGTPLKSEDGWVSDGNGTDEYGFKAIPSGSRSHDGWGGNIMTHAYYWASTEQSPDRMMSYFLYSGEGYVQFSSDDKEAGLSIRCIKD